MTVRLDAHSYPNPDMADYFVRELEQVRQEVLEKKLPELEGFNLIPQDMSIPSWKKTYVHQMYEAFGNAEFVGDDVADFPMVGEEFTEETFNIRKLGCAYKFSFDEMERASQLGKSLQVRRADAARRAHLEAHNEIMFFGDQRQQLFGMLTYPDAPRVVLSDPIDSGTNADTIKDNITQLLVDIWTQTQHTGQPDEIWLSDSAYFELVDREINPGGGGDSTIYEWIIEKHPFISSGDQIRNVRELNGAGPSGRDLLVVGRFEGGSASEVIEHKMVQEFTQRPTEQRNEAMVTNTVSKTGGVTSDYPQEFIVAEVPN